MSKEVVIRLRDDFDKELGETVQTRPFAFNGQAYEIELSNQNFEAMAAAFEPYISAGRPVKKKPSRKKKPPPTRSDNGRWPIMPGGPDDHPTEKTRPSRARRETAAIRQWAIKHGWELPAQGRLPQQVRDEYRAATGNEENK